MGRGDRDDAVVAVCWLLLLLVLFTVGVVWSWLG